MKKKYESKCFLFLLLYLQQNTYLEIGLRIDYMQVHSCNHGRKISPFYNNSECLVNIIDENANNKKLLVGSIATNSHDVFRFTTGHTVYLSSTVLLA